MNKITKFKTLILEKGIKQRHIAKKSGINECIISLIVNGRYMPDKLQRTKIAKAMRMTENDLFSITRKCEK